MAVSNVGGPGNQDGSPIRMTGEQIGGKGPDGNFHIFSTDVFGALNVNTSGGGGSSSVNLVMVGGAAIALGQTTMAASLPTTIASNQSAIPVSGTVTSNQGTANTIANSWPVEITNGTVVLGTPSNPLRIDPTGTTVQPVSGTVALSGTSAFNLTQWAGTVLGTPTNYGTSPGAVIAGSVNAFVTNTVATTLASTTITGTVAVTQSTSPWVDNLTQVAGIVLGATAVTAFGTAPAAANVPGVNSSLFSGTTALTNTAGALNVSITSSATAQTVEGDETNNAAAPEAAAALEVLPAIANAASPAWTEGFNVLESVDLSGRQRIRGTLTPNTAAPSSDGQMALTTIANAVAPTYIEGDLVLASVDLSGATRIIGTRTSNSAAPTFEVNVQPALANAASPTWTEGNQVLESVDLTGRQRIRGTLTNNNAAPTADLIENMPAIATTAAPSYTTGNAVMLSTDLSGNLRVTPTTIGTLTNNNAAPGIINLGVLPALANAASPSWTEGFQVLESVDLTGRQRSRGTLTHNNAAPAADNIGVLPALANAAAPSFTEGDQVLLSTTLTGSLRTSVAGTLVNNNAAPVGTNVGVLPAIANAAAPSWTEGRQVLESVDLAGNMRVGVQNLTTPPSLATGNTAQLQADYVGSLFVKPYRRSETVSQATTIAASSAATTVLAAQAAGIFADISNFIITVTPSTATAAAFTATLSDGTKNYLYDLSFGGTLGTAVSDDQTISFNPPLPATTAATAWTVQLSSSSPTVHITVVAVLQKAS